MVEGLGFTTKANKAGYKGQGFKVQGLQIRQMRLGKRVKSSRFRVNG
jgi:hypothetical protein